MKGKMSKIFSAGDVLYEFTSAFLYVQCNKHQLLYETANSLSHLLRDHIMQHGYDS